MRSIKEMNRTIGKAVMAFAVFMAAVFCGMKMTAYAYTITFHSGSDGQFADGSTENSVTYDKSKQNVTKYSHTDNINNDGVATGKYGFGLNTTDIITIPHADKLHIKLYYSTEKPSSTGTAYDYISVFQGAVSNITTSTTGAKYDKLTGIDQNKANQTEKENAAVKEFDINGDSVSFFFHSDSGAVYYGYYAIITGDEIVTAINSGSYEEPTSNAENYIFTGWHKKEDLSDDAVNIEELTEDTDLYASYKNDVTHSGNLGDEVSWKLYDTEGKLIIYTNNGQNGICKHDVPSYDQKNSTPYWPWTNTDFKDNIKTIEIKNNIKIEGDTKAKNSCAKMFYNLSNLKEIEGLDNLDTSDVTDTSYMFAGCNSLEKLNINFDTKKVIYMEGMFGKGEINHYRTDGSYTTSYQLNASLKNINFGDKFITDNVKSMKNMFQGCYSLTNLDLSNFNTSSVVNIESMFKECSKLKNIRFSNNFTTSKVEKASSLFDGCKSIENLDLSHDPANNEFNTVKLDTSQMTSMYRMFALCNSLKELDVSKFNTEKVTKMIQMFLGCHNIKSLDISSFNTEKVTSMYQMFSKYYESGNENVYNKYENIIFGKNFTTKNVNNMTDMFNGCANLKTLNLSKIPEEGESNTAFFDTKNVGNKIYSWEDPGMDRMFENCRKLESLDISNFNTSNNKNIYAMFAHCSSLKNTDLSNFDTSKVTATGYMFEDCSSLTNLDLSNFDTSNIVNIEGMFKGCSSLTKLNISSFDTSNVKYSDNLFTDANISTIRLGKKYTLKKMPSRASNSMIGTTKGTYTGRWAMGQPYNHVNTLSNDQLEYKYSDSASTYTNADHPTIEALVKKGPETATWYWEINGEDPSAQTYKSIADNWVSKKPVMKDSNKETDTGKTESDFSGTNKDAEGNSGYWTKIDDNTWSYTFNVYDSSIPWYIYEKPVDGYDGDHVVNDDAANSIYTPIENYLVSSESPAVITNTQPKDLGNLTVKKTVVNANNEEQTTDTASFIFTVTLKDAGNNALSKDAVYGTTAFHNGVAKVALKEGESVEFTGIPAGYKYTVEETSTNDYTPKTAILEGTITKDATAEAAFTNTRPEENTDVNGFKVTKTVSGWYWEKPTDGYSFKAAFTGLKKNTEYTYLEDSTQKTFTSDADGDAFAEFTLADGKTATFTNLPVGSTYKVTETGGDYTAEYKITDAENSGNINTTAGKAENGNDLSTGFETVDKNEDITETFTNTIKKTENLTVKKVVDPAPSSSDTFRLTVDFTDIPSDCKGFDSSAGFIANDGGEAEVELQLQNGDTTTFENIPVGTKYKVTEGPTQYTASYTIVNSNKDTSTLLDDGKSTDNTKDFSTNEATVNENYENVTVTFTNTYKTNFALLKTDEDGTHNLPNAKFVLWKYDTNSSSWTASWYRYTEADDGTLSKSAWTQSSSKPAINDPAITDKNGHIYFEDIPAGRYILQEVKSPAAWFDLGRPRAVYVNGSDGKIYYKEYSSMTDAERNALTEGISDMTEWKTTETVSLDGSSITGQWNFLVSDNADTLTKSLNNLKAYRYEDRKNTAPILPDTGAGGIMIFVIAGLVCFAGYEAVNRYNRKAA